MNPTLARFLTRLYPPAWRKRYGAEFEALLETERLGFGTPFEVAWSAFAERFHPTQEVAKEQCFATHVVRPWWRAPSAVFCLAPIPMLAGAYAIACLILWAGWRMFIPGSDSPFGARTQGVANLYFQAGKYYYFAAPVLVGWWLGIIAIRLRVKAVWLTICLLLVAWVGTAARIDANRETVHGEFGHISMSFDFFSLTPDPHQCMLRAATILLLAGFPYLLSRLHRSESIS